MGSRNKKRIVLPSRPEPPTVERILEDVSRAHPSDPVFSVLRETSPDEKGGSGKTELERKYLLSRRFLELNEHLEGARGDLLLRREELQAVGEALDQSMKGVKGEAL
ncbi:UPF0449 protein C19orf25 homolog [Denticeps clupeoides]|uniref:Uncharacterized protein n=1 Tax=Denticeps clupeoides TaxID=299321 RepID=A0AAY4ETZ0_9TELE|nr:UPF0449 protein C19orf25 homolog [Denticeps clupeoides]